MTSCDVVESRGSSMACGDDPVPVGATAGCVGYWLVPLRDKAAQSDWLSLWCPIRCCPTLGAG